MFLQVYQVSTNIYLKIHPADESHDIVVPHQISSLVYFFFKSFLQSVRAHSVSTIRMNFLLIVLHVFHAFACGPPSSGTNNTPNDLRVVPPAYGDPDDGLPVEPSLV